MAFERRRLKVYIAGPISKGDTLRNVHRGIEWGQRMLTDGLAPYVPHLDAYMTLAAAAETPGHSDDWRALLEWDLEWVTSSDALFRLAGESVGGDLEVRIAREQNIPVFHEAPKDDPWELQPLWPGDLFSEAVDYDHDWPGYPELLEYAGQRGLNGRRQYA